MESSPEAEARRRELAREAPISVRTRWTETTWQGRAVCFLCGTLGPAFDMWQRRLAAVSAADAYLSQQIGLDALEREMDALEAEARAAVERTGRRLLPRRSPGYGEMPLELSREILRRLDATKAIGVFLTESNLLVPSKSVTAICKIES